MSTPWSALGDRFLSEGDWSVGQGPDAPDRLLLRRLLRGEGASSLLEVGCGPGIEIEGLRSAGLLNYIDYVGVDLTPELVAGCSERHPDLSFHVADVQQPLPFEADFVWCRHVLEHVEDGEQAMRNLFAAARVAAIVSWFIRPTWKPVDVGSGVAEGFLHQTYDARRMIEVASEIGAALYRFDIDHHLTRASVWILSRQPHDVSGLHWFMQSDLFLGSVIPVPESPRDIELRDELAKAGSNIEQAARLAHG